MSFKLSRFVTAAAVVVVGIVAVEGGVSLATADAPTFVLESGGQPAANVVAGSSVTSRVVTPVANTGSIPVEMSSVWTQSSGRISSLSNITAPEGWTLQYTTNGTTWGAAPGNVSTITGVKATGTVASNGYANASQKFATSGSATVRPALAAFQGSSGGDGWDVFFGLGKVYNIYHHNVTDLGVDCHDRITGAYCWTFNNVGGAYFLNGYTTGARSTGYVHEATSRLWALVKKNSTSEIGFVCVDVSGASPAPCANVGSSGFVSLATTALGGYEGITDLVVHNSMLWSKTNDANSGILCLDLATAAACANQPFLPAQGYTSPSGGYTAGRVKAFAGKMYITSANTQFDCFDLSTLTRCAVTGSGTWPKTGGTFSNALFAVTSNNGSTIQAVCTHNNSSSCFTPGGEAYTYPSGLPGTTDAATAGWGDNYNLGDKYYYINGNSSFGCWNFGTGAACAGYSSATLGNYVYAVQVDPIDRNCLWSNSDNGQIKPFNATTGALGCAPANGTVDFTPQTFIKRLSCVNSSKVATWTSLAITPPNGVLTTSARLTVMSGGTAVAGWSAVQPNGSGVFDLTSLTTQLSGLEPTFAVEFIGSTANQLTGTTGTLSYTGAPAELCVDLTAHATCPTGHGQNLVSTTPGSPIDVNSQAIVNVGANGAVTTTQTRTASAADLSTCLGTVSGTLREAVSNDPVAGAKVTMILEDGQIIETTSDANGGYSIPRLYPDTYALIFSPTATLAPTTAAGSAVVTANTTTTKNGTYSASALFAPSMRLRVYPTWTTTFSISANGGTGSLLSSGTKLIDPDTRAAVSNVALSGQPTWNVQSGSYITAQVGLDLETYHAIYKIETTGGDVAHGLLTVEVVPIIFIPPSTTTAPTPSAPPTTLVPPTPSTLAPGVTPEPPLGESMVYENGQPIPVVLEKVDEGSWKLVGEDFEMTMEIPAGDTPGSAEGVVTLIRNREVEVGGFGFQPNTYVDVWMIPSTGPSQQSIRPMVSTMATPAIFLGTILVNADGTFAAPLPVPANVDIGPYTLQANGTSFDGVSRSLNLGVRLLGDEIQLPVTGRNSHDMTTWAWLLIIAGASMIVVIRRRPTR